MASDYLINKGGFLMGHLVNNKDQVYRVLTESLNKARWEHQ